MAKLTSSVPLIALFLIIATTSVVNSQTVQVIGRGLTCSNPSPIPFFPPLSNATVRLSCFNGATQIGTATTNANGNFTITVIPVPGFPPFVPTFCRVFVTVPPVCVIYSASGQRVTMLGSVAILQVPGQPNVYQATSFAFP